MSWFPRQHLAMALFGEALQSLFHQVNKPVNDTGPEEFVVLAMSEKCPKVHADTEKGYCIFKSKKLNPSCEKPASPCACCAKLVL